METDSSNNTETELNTDIDKISQDTKQDERLLEIEATLETLRAEEVVISRITKDVVERVEKKTNRNNIIALLVIIIANVGSLNIALPQFQKDIEQDVREQVDEAEQQIEEQVEEQIEKELDRQ